MDDFTIRSGPGGTEIAMSRWEGGLLAGSAPAICTVSQGQGGVGAGAAVPQRAAGRHRRRAARRRRRARLAHAAWHAPAQLAEGARAILDPGQRLGLAVAAVSALDGRLAWLRAGAVSCVLLRGDSDIVLFPPAATALSRSGGGPLRAATIDVRRDDVLVLSVTPLAPERLAELALRGAEAPDAPAFVTARFERGTLEPRRPPGSDRRGVDATTMEGP